LDSIRATLSAAGLKLREGSEVGQKLSQLRRMYEPYVDSLSHYLHIRVPPWIPESDRIDSWQTSAWGRSRGFQIEDLSDKAPDDHF
jgi:hypothetical protein